jgi:hypothetical protein
VTNQVVDVTVDALVTVEDLLGPWRLFAALELCGGVLPLGPEWLVANMPEMFESLGAARRFKRNAHEWLAGDARDVELYAYRPAGQRGGSDSSAVIWKGLTRGYIDARLAEDNEAAEYLMAVGSLF